MTDETTSPERQRESANRAALEIGVTFDGREAVDLDVSASKTSPFERPQLGEWLRRPTEYDVLVWWRFDRAIRSMGDMHELAKWAKEHRKMLVFAEGLGGGGRLQFDFRNPMDPVSEMMMLLFAFAAQVEAVSIRDRVLGAQAAMRLMPLRWRGSRPPFGYAPEPLEGGGWTLVPDPDAVKVLERIIRELLDTDEAKSPNAVAVALNNDNVPSPRDYWAAKKGRESGGKRTGPKRVRTKERVDAFHWTGGAITSMLTSEALIGWKVHRGKPVRDSEGRPVMAVRDPVLTRAEFDALGNVLASRSASNGVRRDTDALLLHILVCAGCGGFMYLSKQSSRPAAYKCGARQRSESCDEPTTIKQEWADQYAEREFLKRVGHMEVVHVVTVPGYDPGPELDAVAAEFAEHQAQKGRQKSKAGAAMWQARADALDARMAELEGTPAIEATTREVRTGRTYASDWYRADAGNSRRRRMLAEAGVRVVARKGVAGGWRSLDESRVSFDMGYRYRSDPEAAALEAVADELSRD